MASNGSRPDAWLCPFLQHPAYASTRSSEDGRKYRWIEGLFGCYRDFSHVVLPRRCYRRCTHRIDQTRRTTGRHGPLQRRSPNLAIDRRPALGRAATGLPRRNPRPVPSTPSRNPHDPSKHGRSPHIPSRHDRSPHIPRHNHGPPPGQPRHVRQRQGRSRRRGLRNSGLPNNGIPSSAGQ